MPHQKEYPILNCIICGGQIDPGKVIKAGSHPPEHCSHDCLVETQRREGHFAKMGALGNQSQQAFKAKEGYVPEYENRVSGQRETLPI